MTLHPKRILAALTLATLVAAACSPAGSGDDDNGDGGGQSGPFVVARTGDIDLLDPAKATAFQTVQTLDLVYDTLIDTDDEGELEPGLAEEWEVSDDGKTVTLTLREGVTFHNGETFTAADAKATLERVLDEKTGSAVASNLVNVTNIDDRDDTTLVLTLSKPDTAILNVLSQVGTSILDDADIEAGTVEREVNGTGPFRWGSWEQGQKVTLKANDDFWGDAPQLKTVELRVIPDESSISSGMVAGNFNLGVISDPSVVQDVNPDDMQVLEQPTMSYHTLMLNGRRGPLKKLAVRQAIACAIDRQQVIETAYFGKGEVTGPITSPAFEYDPVQGLPCDAPDMSAAKDLLAKAGYEDGFTLNTIVMTGEYSTAVNISQNLQAQLKEIGVNLKLNQQRTNVYVDNWLAAKFDAAVALNGGSSDPYLMYARYYTKEASLAAPAGLSDPTLDQLLQDGNATTDDAERQTVFQQLQEELLRLSPWVWLLNNQSFYLVGKDIEGFKALPSESLEYLTKASVGG